MLRFAIDSKNIYAERVRDRRVVYLDTNAWSDLSERATDHAKRAFQMAMTTSSAHITVFPLAYATITEVLKRDVNADSMQQAELMDSLSCGVSLRGYPHVRDLEVSCAFEMMTQGTSAAPIAEMFTVIACYISDDEVPVVGMEAPSLDKLARPIYPTLRWLQENKRTSEFLDRHAVTDEKYVLEITKKLDDAPQWASDRSGKLNANTLRFEEHTAAFKNYVLRNLFRLVEPADMEQIANKLDVFAKTPGPAATARVINAMPSIALSCEMHVQRTLAGTRRVRKQDFYDHEHAARAIPYVNAFVTSDRGLLDVLRRSKVTATYKCEILAGMAPLANYLEKLAGMS